MKITEDQQELILYKVKEMLEDEDIVVFEEISKNDLTYVKYYAILSKKIPKIMVIINKNNIIKYDEETIAKILAK